MNENWWSRDIEFPNFWPAWPLVLVASVLLGALLAALVETALLLMAAVFAIAGFVALWGPWGIYRDTRDPRRASGLALLVVAAGLVLCLVAARLLST